MAYFDKNKFKLTSNISLVVFSPPHSNFINRRKNLYFVMKHCAQLIWNWTWSCSLINFLTLTDQTRQKLIEGVFECSLALGASYLLLYEPCELYYLLVLKPRNPIFVISLSRKKLWMVRQQSWAEVHAF